MQRRISALYLLFLCGICLLFSSFDTKDDKASVFDRPYVQVTPPGLSSQTAYSLLRDQNGFIWVSTRNGIDRFDGIAYRHYTLGTTQMRTMRSGLSISIYCDEDGRIWAYTERSDIYCFNPVADAFVEVIYLPDYQIWGSAQALYCAGDLLVIGATDGITCYDIPTKTITKRLCPDEDIHTFYSFRNGEVLFGARRGVGVLNINDLRGTLQSWVNSDIKYLFYDKEHQKLWVGTNGNGLYVLDPSHPKNVQQVGNTEGLIVTGIAPLDENEMLIGVDGGGVLVFPSNNIGSNTKLRRLASIDDAPFMLRTAGVRSILVDQGRIWIATYMGGVTCLQPGSTLTTLNANIIRTVSDNYAFGVDVAPDGRYWVAFSQSIGSFAPDGSDQKTYLEHEAGFLTVRAARDGTIWAGGFNTGTYHFDPRTGKREHYASLVDQHVLDCVYDIYEDSHGDIWVGGLNFQLTRLHQLPDNTFEKTHYPITLINSLAQLDDETIIASTTDGFKLVNMISNEVKIYLNDEEKWIGTNYIADARTRAGHEVWVATAGAGLLCYNLTNDSIEAFGLENGLPSLELRGMSIANDSILYVSTEKNGIFAFDCVNRCYIRSMMTSDGLPMNEFLQNSSTITHNGNLLFGGDNGAVVLRESDITSTHKDFSIIVDTKGLKENIVRRGSDESHTIDIQLSTSDIYHQKEYIFFYRMEGIEKEWTIIDNTRQIKFSHLPPGFYELEILAIGAANQTQTRTIEIEIEASSFWAAHIIKISYLLLIISLICLIMTIRLYLINKKNKK